MTKLNYDQRQAFKRLVRLNSGFGRRFTLTCLKGLRDIARLNPMAGAYSGYSG